ncbi:MAG: hypothetical protein ACLVB4_05525 [Butyricicoccus sp.]
MKIWKRIGAMAMVTAFRHWHSPAAAAAAAAAVIPQAATAGISAM